MSEFAQYRCTYILFYFYINRGPPDLKLLYSSAASVVYKGQPVSCAWLDAPRFFHTRRTQMVRALSARLTGHAAPGNTWVHRQSWTRQRIALCVWFILSSPQPCSMYRDPRHTPRFAWCERRMQRAKFDHRTGGVREGLYVRCKHTCMRTRKPSPFSRSASHAHNTGPLYTSYAAAK